MPRKEAPLNQLQTYLPLNTFEAVRQYLHQYQVHLTVAKERKSILGDYRHRTHGKTHRISVNGNLNKYAFLITLLHELAHLLAFEKYGNRIVTHGREWKSVYSNILKDFVSKKIFPADITQALTQSLHNPAASSCAEEGLMRVLRHYDEKKKDTVLLEEIPQGSYF